MFEKGAQSMGVITNWIRAKSENNNVKKSETNEQPTTKIEDFPKIFFLQND